MPKSRPRAPSPSPDQIKKARESAGLTQTQAAQVIHSALRTWQQYEAGDRNMHAGLWELFTSKVKRSKTKPLV